jgi:hypothetical protein
MPARPRADRAAAATLAVVVLAAVVLVATKSARVPISTDEAWSYNDWITRGFTFTWTDYQHPNNH